MLVGIFIFVGDGLVLGLSCYHLKIHYVGIGLRECQIFGLTYTQQAAVITSVLLKSLSPSFSLQCAHPSFPKHRVQD